MKPQPQCKQTSARCMMCAIQRAWIQHRQANHVHRARSQATQKAINQSQLELPLLLLCTGGQPPRHGFNLQIVLRCWIIIEASTMSYIGNVAFGIIRCWGMTQGLFRPQPSARPLSSKTRAAWEMDVFFPAPRRPQLCNMRRKGLHTKPAVMCHFGCDKTPCGRRGQRYLSPTVGVGRLSKHQSTDTQLECGQLHV